MCQEGYSADNPYPPVLLALSEETRDISNQSSHLVVQKKLMLVRVYLDPRQDSSPSYSAESGNNKDFGVIQSCKP